MRVLRAGRTRAADGRGAVMIEVVWTGGDGTNRVDTYEAAESTMQILPGPVGSVKLYDGEGRYIGGALYGPGLRIRRGTAIGDER